MMMDLRSQEISTNSMTRVTRGDQVLPSVRKLPISDMHFDFTSSLPSS